MDPSWPQNGAKIRLGASCGRLGSVSEVSCARFSIKRALHLGKVFGIPFFDRFLVYFASENRFPKYAKIMKFYWKNKHFLLSGYLNIRLLLDAIRVSTLLHFCTKNPPKSRLGAVLGRLVGVLAASWAVLRRFENAQKKRCEKECEKMDPGGVWKHPGPKKPMGCGGVPRTPRGCCTNAPGWGNPII